jgi:glycerol-3-phosphate acyltransferase PlsY
MINLILFLLFSFLLGSIPSGYWLGRIFKNIDIRKSGSGNIGATNAVRTLGWPIGIWVYPLDISKGLVPIIIAKYLYSNESLILSLSIICLLAGFLSVLGHVFSPFVKFKGGKGVNAAAGVILGLSWQVFLICLAIFIFIAIISRTVSISSIAAGISLPIAMFFFSQPKEYTIFSLIIAVVVIVRHKDNIIRLVQGKEFKVSKNDKKTQKTNKN